MSGDAQWQRAAPLPLAIRAGWGATLLIAPGGVLRLFGGVDRGERPRLIMRVLGGRHLVQTAAEYRFGSHARKIGILVDVLHGATSVAFAVKRPRWRRAAATDAVVAGAFALLGLANG
jgi:hypothetical protein